MQTEFQDVVELAKGSHYTIVLDDQLRVLKPALEDEGYKVILPSREASDDEIKELAKAGWTILTANSKDFVDDAAHSITTLSQLKAFSSGIAGRIVGTRR